MQELLKYLEIFLAGPYLCTNTIACGGNHVATTW